MAESAVSGREIRVKRALLPSCLQPSSTEYTAPIQYHLSPTHRLQPRKMTEMTDWHVNFLHIPLHSMTFNSRMCFMLPPLCGVADAEIKVSSGENTELKRSPFKAWSRPIHSHTCYAYCQGFLPCLFLLIGSLTCIFPKPLPIFPVLAVANT